MALRLNRTAFALALLAMGGCDKSSGGTQSDVQTLQTDVRQSGDADTADLGGCALPDCTPASACGSDCDGAALPDVPPVDEYTDGTDTDAAPPTPCLLADGTTDPACCLVDGGLYAPGEVLPGYTCEVCGEKSGSNHYPIAPDGTVCGPQTDEMEYDYRHCIQGTCCSPQEGVFWDLWCGCGKFQGFISDCPDEESAWSRYESTLTCADQCGGYCCRDEGDCPQERPLCAAFVDSTEGMNGWCVAEVEPPSCWVDAQCPAPQKCRGGSAEEATPPVCIEDGSAATPGTCGE